MAVDKQGFTRMQAERAYTVNGNMKSSKMAYMRHTINTELTLWVSPSKTIEGYIVEKATHLGNYEFDTKKIATFPTAVEAKEWVNTEFAHLLK